MLLLLAMSAVHAQEATDEFMKEVSRAIELSNVTKNFTEGGDRANARPLVDQGIFPADKVEAIVKEFEEFAVPLLKKKMIALYKEKFTHEELKQINAYLSSPVGQKATKLMPEFAAEGMKIVQTPEAQQKTKEIVLKYLSK